MFICKPANSFIREASLKPIPKMLFSELWVEGELCVLFADTNVGKSILAVQIADSISKGVPIENFKLEADKQRILYFDFELSSKQFEARYSSNYYNHYQFDDNFIRSEIDVNSSIHPSYRTIQDHLEAEIVEQGCSIIIVDNLSYIAQDNEKGSLALDLMTRLKELKTKHGLSILVLSHTPKREFDRPISNNDLQGSKNISNFADSIVAIGKSYSDSNLRYIKQIKQRNFEHIYNEENVILCKLSKGETNNFLQFQFVGYDSEYNHLNYVRSNSKEALKQYAKQLRIDGLNNSKIARELAVSEGTIRNWLDK